MLYLSHSNLSMLYWTNPGSNIPQNSSCTATYLPSQKPSKLDKQDMLDTAGEVRTNSWVTFSYGPLHTDELELDNKLSTTGYSLEDLPEVMNNSDEWQVRVREIRANGTTWWWWMLYKKFNIFNLNKMLHSFFPVSLKVFIYSNWAWN